MSARLVYVSVSDLSPPSARACPQLQTVPLKLRRGEVLRVLQDSKNKSAFQSGREHKKRPGLWSLRVKAPPPAPTVELRLVRPVTEHSLKAVRVHYNNSRKSKQIT